MVEVDKFSKKCMKFFLSGSASLYEGYSPIVLKHIELEDNSDLIRDPPKTKDSNTLTQMHALGWMNVKLHMKYTNLEWESAVYVVCKMMNNWKDKFDFKALIECAESPKICKESVIFTLAALTLVKGHFSNVEKVMHDAYVAMLKICTTTREFFLFIQLRKLLSVNCYGIASGKGFRKAVKRWYEGHQPSMLFLELIRAPRGFKWRHKELLQLCHCAQKTQSIEFQVIYSYIFSSKKKTKDKFANVEGAEYMLILLDKLTFEDPKPTIDQYMARAQFINGHYNSSSYLDFPTHCYVHKKMWEFVVTNAPPPDILAALTYTNLARIVLSSKELTTLLVSRFDSYYNPLNDQLQIIFAMNRFRKVYLGLYKQVDDQAPLVWNAESILVSLDSLIMKGMKQLSKTNDRTMKIFINEADMREFKKVTTILSPFNEIKAIQAATYIIHRLYSTSGNVQAFLSYKDIDTVTDLSLNFSSFYGLQGIIKNLNDEEKKTVDFDTLLNDECSTFIFIYYRFTEDDINKINQKFASQPRKKARFILVGIEFNAAIKKQTCTNNEDFLVINEFSSGTLNLIAAFANREI